MFGAYSLTQPGICRVSWALIVFPVKEVSL